MHDLVSSQVGTLNARTEGVRLRPLMPHCVRIPPHDVAQRGWRIASADSAVLCATPDHPWVSKRRYRHSSVLTRLRLAGSAYGAALVLDVAELRNIDLTSSGVVTR